MYWSVMGSYNWIVLLGQNLEFTKNSIVFNGGISKNRPEDPEQPFITNALCNQLFGGGKLSAEIEFGEINEDSACEFIITRDPKTGSMLNVGLGGHGYAYSIRSFIPNDGSSSTFPWNHHGSLGLYSYLKANKKYHIEVVVNGSNISLIVDGVNVISTTLPFTITQGQPGLFFRGNKGEIRVSNFKVRAVKQNVFVVMQYKTPYNELYDKVIKSVCDAKFSLHPVRADETYGPGLIISDITRLINESILVIAEISGENPNVFYEVGYSHALNKPTILVAEKGTQLPFDVSPFRTLFYENSIDGKDKFEEGLSSHIEAIIGKENA